MYIIYIVYYKYIFECVVNYLTFHLVCITSYATLNNNIGILPMLRETGLCQFFINKFFKSTFMDDRITTLVSLRALCSVATFL